MTIKVARKEQRRLAMLEKASEIFLENGYGDASISTIAARIGGSKATLYSYFPSKEELFVAAIEHRARVWANVVLDMIPERGDLPETLHAYGKRMLSVVLTDEFLAFRRLVAGEAARFPSVGQTYYDACVRFGLTHVASFIEEAMVAGKLDRDDPLVAAERLNDLYQSSLLRRRMYGSGAMPSEAAIETHLEETTALFLRAYGWRE